MKRYTEGLDPHTGEYFYKDTPKPRPQNMFVLDFENPRTQLEGKCSPAWVERIVEMVHHMDRLRSLGVLPTNYHRRVKKQITLKAASAVRKFKSDQ